MTTKEQILEEAFKIPWTFPFICWNFILLNHIQNIFCAIKSNLNLQKSSNAIGLKHIFHSPRFKPLFIIGNTVKGKGVSFMENKPIWHYRSPSKEEYEIALKELGF